MTDCCEVERSFLSTINEDYVMLCYVTLVEDRHILSAEYLLSLLATTAHPAVRFLYDS